jgi:hypothetical protein
MNQYFRMSHYYSDSDSKDLKAVNALKAIEALEALKTHDTINKKRISQSPGHPSLRSR